MKPLVRIIARKVPWPDLKARSDRSGLRLRWDALHEETGELLVATEYPLADSAHALMMRGLNSATLVTMRHEGAAHDSFALTLVRRACPAPTAADQLHHRDRQGCLSADELGETLPENSPRIASA